MGGISSLKKLSSRRSLVFNLWQSLAFSAILAISESSSELHYVFSAFVIDHVTLSHRLKLFVDFHLMSGHEAVILVGQPYHRQHLVELRFSHPLFSRRGGVGGDAVIALVAHAHRHVDQLFHQRVERARS